jgi:hypothetical protein
VSGSFSHPFSDSSLWNTPIANLNPTYTDPNSTQNEQFRDASLGNTWAQVDPNLIDVTPSNAPTATWTFNTLNTTPVGGSFSNNGSIQLQTPTNLQFVHGSDGWSVFTSPDGVHSWEVWGGSYDAATNTYHANYLVENDVVNGTGWGNPATGAGAGIRAAGASLLGGVVTQDELNNLSIPHALPIELAPDQLAAAGGSTSQFVAPAVSADGGSASSYSGTIPMGAHFAIPSNIDLSTAGLTPEGLALAKAYQTYGGYVVDTAANTTSLAEIDGGTQQQTADIFKDLGWIRDHLVMTNDQGAGASAAQPAPADPGSGATPAAGTSPASADNGSGAGTPAAGTSPTSADSGSGAGTPAAGTSPSSADSGSGASTPAAGSSPAAQDPSPSTADAGASTGQHQPTPAAPTDQGGFGFGHSATDAGFSGRPHADMHAAFASLAQGIFGQADASHVFNPNGFGMGNGLQSAAAQFGHGAAAAQSDNGAFHAGTLPMDAHFGQAFGSAVADTGFAHHFAMAEMWRGM